MSNECYCGQIVTSLFCDGGAVMVHSQVFYWLNCFLSVVFGLFSGLLQHFWHYEAHFGAVVQLNAYFAKMLTGQIGHQLEM
jgi:hypothetical protein